MNANVARQLGMEHKPVKALQVTSTADGAWLSSHLRPRGAMLA